MALVSLAAARKGKHPTAPQANAGQPRILIHSINDDRCTGCDACVAVCPTNVLDLVENKSRVLRFQDCIQCEACMWACPTTALVMHLEGTEPPPYKMPELDENFQTAVPGQYLIGEVAGKPLVKNAANLGRVVVEHMLRTGLQPGYLAQMGDPGAVDVAIVGSGPGGLSAALSCIQRGLSHVVLEKEQLVASTIARYPKGKLVMAEPYDVRNLSLLPVFDSSKEQIIPIWQQLMQQTGISVKLGEAVEGVTKQADGTFQVRTTVAGYRAQRVVLATGTRGKPRTLGVPGENLPKVFSLLDDPDVFRGQPVIVVGGGDSAVEAAIALADSGARVILSYRGRAFNRAQPKNKQTIESYEAQRRVKIRYQSNIIEFTADTVTLEMPNGQRKTYPNQAAFVLIGSDPPIKWLEKLGVHFVERPHMYESGKTDNLVERMVGAGAATDCPEDAARAAAQVRGQAVGPPPPAPTPPMQQPMDSDVSGPRKWLRSATAIFTTSRSKLEQPIPLSEFAKRSRRKHTGHGRRDALDPSERTRVLRMLRDEGGRIADEESRIDIPALPPRQYDDDDDSQPFLFDDVDPTAEPPMQLDSSPSFPTYEEPQNPFAAQPPNPFAANANPFHNDQELEAKPAVIVGLERARANRQNHGGNNHRVPERPPPRHLDDDLGPPQYDEPTRQVDADSALARLLRDRARHEPMGDYNYEESTRAVDIDAAAYMAEDDDDPTHMAPFEEPTRNVDPEQFFRASHGAPAGDDSHSTLDIDPGTFGFDEYDAPTRTVDVNELERNEPRPRKKIRYPNPHEESTRAVDIDQFHDPRRDDSLSDIDWDLD